MPRKTKTRHMQYEEKSLEKAVDAVKRGVMSYRTASQQFGVPKTTIIDHVQGRYAPASKPGRPTVIPAAMERSIVDRVVEASTKGFGITKRQLLLKTARLCKSLHLKTPFKNGIPGDDWWRGVKLRHPELVLRKPEKLNTSRARMMNKTVVQKFFDDLGKIISALNLHDKPRAIWNCDETGKQMEHRPVSVCARRRARNILGRPSDNRENITILACINAAGCSMPPMCIVKGKTLRSLHTFSCLEAPPGTIWTYQKKAWMCDVLGVEWFQGLFLKHCGPDRPQLLIVDSHSSHEVLGLLEEAKKENIHILSLPPHTKHFLQPLDRTVFGPFSKAYNQACTKFLPENPGLTIDKCSWPRLFRYAWSASFTKQNIRKGFRATGICPLDMSAIPESAYQPSTMYERKNTMNLPSRTASSSSVSDQFPIPVSVLNLKLEEESQSFSFSTSPRLVSSQKCTVNSITPSASTQRYPSEPIVFMNVPTDLFESASNPCNAISGSDVYHHSTSPNIVPFKEKYSPNGPSMVANDFETTSFLMSLANGNSCAVEDLEAISVLVSLANGNSSAVEDVETTPVLMSHADGNSSSANIGSECILQEGFDSLPGKHTWSSTWNTDLENIFGITPVEREEKVKSKALTCHRLLTSDEIIKDKRNAEILKSTKAAEKEERKRKELERRII